MSGKGEGDEGVERLGVGEGKQIWLKRCYTSNRENEKRKTLKTKTAKLIRSN